MEGSGTGVPWKKRTMLFWTIQVQEKGLMGWDVYFNEKCSMLIWSIFSWNISSSPFFKYFVIFFLFLAISYFGHIFRLSSILKVLSWLWKPVTYFKVWRYTRVLRKILLHYERGYFEVWFFLVIESSIMKLIWNLRRNHWIHCVTKWPPTFPPSNQNTSTQ